MNETRSWLRRPRYSPLFLGIFVLGITGSAFCGLFTTANAIWDRAQRVTKAAFASPLPDVAVASTASGPRPAAYRKPYELSNDWFTKHLPVWEQVLEPYKGEPGVSYLEIGTYEGASLLWMLENICTDPMSRVTGIDIFEGPYKDTYFHNIELSGSADKVTTLTGFSQEILRGLPLDSFDIVYVDGSHQTADVLEDAVLSWRLLKVGGLMIFDDYEFAGRAGYNQGDPFGFPKPAIDAFAQCFRDRCEVVHREWQVVIRKTRE
jgi:hypothetical protein